MRRAASVAVGLLALVSLASAAGTDWTLVSVNGAGAYGNGTSGEPAVTPNGRWVAFHSQADDIVPGETLTKGQDVFVRDMKSGTTEVVSRNPAGDEGNGSSHDPCISNNGRWVLFTSNASDLVADENAFVDVFAADRRTGEIARVSVGFDGSAPDADSYAYGRCLSANGKRAVFASKATNLVEGLDTYGYYQIYLRDLAAGTTTLVSRDRDDPTLAASGTCLYPSLSPNGRFVVYCCNSANIVPGNSNGREHVYVFDTKTGTSRRVSVGPMGVLADQDSYDAEVSDNGRVVTFYSLAGNLAGAADAGGYDAFIADQKAGTVCRMSESAQTMGAYDATMSASGKVVFFYAEDTDLVDGDGNATGDVFRYDVKTGALTRISLGPTGVEGNGYTYLFGPSLAPNGKWLAVASDAGNLLADPGTPGTTTNIFLVKVK